MTMILKANKRLRVNGITYNLGETFDCDIDTGRDLVHSGLAGLISLKGVKKISKENLSTYFVLHHVSNSEGYGCLGREIMFNYPTDTGELRDNVVHDGSIRINTEDIPEGSTVIQMCAGDLFKNLKHKFRSVGFTMFETNKIPKDKRDWASNINSTVDLLLVPATQVKEVFEKCGVEVPVEVVPLWVNESYNYIDRPERKLFKFLWVGKMDKWNRKGFMDAIQAFRDEFKETDVRLILKASKASKGQELDKSFYDLVEEDSRITIIDKTLMVEELRNLYGECDCFVFPTHGEGFGIPPLEAMATGLPTILTSWMGCADFSDEEFNYPIPVKYLEDAKYPEIYGNVGKWAYVDQKILRKLMRYVYKHREEAKDKGKKASEMVDKRFRFKNFSESLANALSAKKKSSRKVSIIVTARDELEILRACIDSVYRNTNNFELIIIDNGSGQATKEYLAEQYGIKLHTNKENMGYAYAVNQGLKLAKHDFICMLDSDTIVSPNWLERMMECFEADSQCGIVTPSQQLLKDMVFTDFKHKEGNSLIEEIDEYGRNLKGEPVEVPFNKTYGFCHLISRKVYEDIGSYDWKRYRGTAVNETDYFWRAFVRGFKIYWAKGAFVYHFGGKVKKSLGMDPVDMVKRGNKIFAERKEHAEDYFVRNDVFMEDI